MEEQEALNICPGCGAENTIWPVFRGKKRFYACEHCGAHTRGVSKRQFLNQKDDLEIKGVQDE